MVKQDSKVNFPRSISCILNMEEEELKAYIAEAASRAPQHRTEMEELVLRVTALAMEGNT